MNRFSCLSLSLLVVLAGTSSLLSAAERRPNILVIFSDDHGWADLGIQGVDKDIQTPHLDQLAREGVLFKRGYVTAPQCTPSRAGLMSGVYQNRIGVEHNGIPMRSDVVTFPERLQAAGYVTGQSGKWHLDVDSPKGAEGPKNKFLPELAPQHQGFAEYFTGFMQDYSASHGLDGSPFPDAPHAVRDERNRVVIQTEAALAFLRRRQAEPDRPWFHYLAYMAPHVPLQSPEPWFSRTSDKLAKERRQALALLGAIDDGIGRIRAQLKEMGQDRNTLIFFIGDNGAPLGNSWDGSLNLPMRGQKGMLSEGGIRVPFVAAWPGSIPSGQTFDHPVISLDVAATACAAAGVDAGGQLDGVNLLPHLTGQTKKPPHETLYWRWMSQAAIQEYPYKLIALGGRDNLLFDVSTPEGEAFERNLIREKPDVAARLTARLEAWTADLKPPGMPPKLADRHVQLFAEHGLSEAVVNGAVATAPSSPSPGDGAIQGWICRTGTIALNGGALVVTPDKGPNAKGRTFITNSSLNIPGPASATLRIRGTQGGPATVTWRTKVASFALEQTARFDWPESREWQTVTVGLPEKNRIIHVRITPPKGATVEVQSIELKGELSKPQLWKFDGSP